MRPRWLIAAGAAGLMGLAAWAVLLSRELTEAGRELVHSTAYVAQMSSELETTRADADLLVDTLAVLRADGLRELDLRGAHQAKGRVLVSSRGFVLLVSGLDSLGPGRVYQAWSGALDGAPVSMGIFDVNSFGMATVVRTRPEAPGEPVVSVTAEPAGGSSTPTSRPVLTGP